MPSKPVDPIVRADLELGGALDAPRVGVVEDVADERRLARAGDAGDRDQPAERDPHGHVAEVVLPGADDRDRALGAAKRHDARARGGSAAARGRASPAGRVRGRRARRAQQLPGGRALHARQSARRALEEEPSPEAAGPGPQVDEVVRRLDRFGIVLHDHDRVAAVRQSPKDARAAAGCPRRGARSSARRARRAFRSARRRARRRGRCAAPRRRRACARGATRVR